MYLPKLGLILFQEAFHERISPPPPSLSLSLCTDLYLYISMAYLFEHQLRLIYHLYFIFSRVKKGMFGFLSPRSYRPILILYFQAQVLLYSYSWTELTQRQLRWSQGLLRWWFRWLWNHWWNLRWKLTQMGLRKVSFNKDFAWNLFP